MRRELSQKHNANMLMTTTLNSALYRDETNEDLHDDSAGSASILHTASTLKTQIISSLKSIEEMTSISFALVLNQ